MHLLIIRNRFCNLWFLRLNGWQKGYTFSALNPKAKKSCMQIMYPLPSKSEVRTLELGRQKLPTFLEERYIF